MKDRKELSQVIESAGFYARYVCATSAETASSLMSREDLQEKDNREIKAAVNSQDTQSVVEHAFKFIFLGGQEELTQSIQSHWDNMFSFSTYGIFPKNTFLHELSYKYQGVEFLFGICYDINVKNEIDGIKLSTIPKFLMPENQIVTKEQFGYIRTNPPSISAEWRKDFLLDFPQQFLDCRFIGKELHNIKVPLQIMGKTERYLDRVLNILYQYLKQE